jgi:hypothetical protein
MCQERNGSAGEPALVHAERQLAREGDIGGRQLQCGAAFHAYGCARGHTATACRTACSQFAINSAARARVSVGRKRRSTCHCAASSSRLL